MIIAWNQWLIMGCAAAAVVWLIRRIFQTEFTFALSLNLIQFARRQFKNWMHKLN